MQCSALPCRAVPCGDHHESSLLVTAQVCLTLEMRGAVTASTQLVFRYLPVLRIITVEVYSGFPTVCRVMARLQLVRTCAVPQCDGDQSLLVSLLPHDTGEMTPRLSNHHVKVADGSFLDACAYLEGVGTDGGRQGALWSVSSDRCDLSRDCSPRMWVCSVSISFIGCGAAVPLGAVAGRPLCPAARVSWC